MSSRMAVGGLAALAVGLAAGGTLSPRPVHADPAPKAADTPTGTGYVEMSRLLKECKRAQVSVAELNALRQKKTAELAALRDKFTAKQAAAAAAAGDAKLKLDKEAFDASQKFQAAEADIKRDLDARAQKVILLISKEVRKAAADVAQARSLAAVHGYPMTPDTQEPMAAEMFLRPPAVTPLYLAAGQDITDEVLAKMNRAFDREQQDGD